MTIVASVLVLIFFTSVGFSFSCFPEENQTKLYYQNRPDKIIDDLPTMRLIQGYWPSMWASQYIAYIFIKEKMGVNVSFYPSDDPYVYYYDYNGSFSYTMKKSDKICGYPEWFYCFMADNSADLIFEMWPLMLLEDYLTTNGSVFHGGYSNVIAEQSIFIPKYLVRSNRHSIIPYDLKYNESLRQAIIDAYTTKGDINWYNEIKNIRQKNFNNSWAFDVLNESKPTVFGSYDGYIVMEHFHNVTHNVPVYDEMDSLGIDFNFVTFGNELNLSNMISDLYNKKLPFIVSIYSPHYDFATVINNSTSEIMEFEKISLPRNPSNTIDDKCYSKGQCTAPLELLYKLGRKALVQDFPEMIYFLSKYTLDVTDINTVLRYYTNISNSDSNNEISEHLRWLKASCKWLKENIEDIEKDWSVNIRRDYYPMYKYGKSSKIGFTVMFLILIIVLIGSILWMLMNVKYRFIVATAPYMSIVMTVGLVFICIGNIIYIYQPMNLVKCNFYEYFINIGLVLSISTPLLKSYRIVMIISKARKLKKILIKDKHLIQYLFIITSVVILPLVMYTIFSIQVGTKQKTLKDESYKIITCNKNNQLTYIQNVMDVYIFVLLFSMVILSWNSKSASKLLLFKETTCTIFSSFLSLFSYFILFAFRVSTEDYDILITVQLLLYMICIIIIWLLYYGRIIKKFYNKPLKERHYSSKYQEKMEKRKDIKNTMHSITNDNNIKHQKHLKNQINNHKINGNENNKIKHSRSTSKSKSSDKLTLSQLNSNSTENNININHLESPYVTPDFNSVQYATDNENEITKTELEETAL